MSIKLKVIAVLVVGILFSPRAFVSANVFADLDEIANDQRSSFENSKQKIQQLIEAVSDPIIIKTIILRSSEHASLCYIYEQKEKYERYDEAIFIGICRLIQINTDESITQLVDLMKYDLGASNYEILGQRITEIGRPALKPLQTRLEELENKVADCTEGSQKRAMTEIRLIQNYIANINEGRKFNAGVGPCFTVGKD